MTRYSEDFGTDWETLDPDAAAERAYAIGVGERLGEDDRDELERIYAEMETAYERTMVELAYDEGRRDAATVAQEHDRAGSLWSALVEEGPISIDADDVETGGRDGLPEALGPAEVLDGFDADSTGATDRPGFLDR